MVRFEFDLNFPDPSSNTQVDFDLNLNRNSHALIENFDLNINSRLEDEFNFEISQSRHEESHFDIDDDEEESPSSKKYKILTKDDRRKILDIMLKKSVDGELKKGVIKMVASQFLVSTKTVQRIWKYGNTLKSNNSGRKKIEIDLDRIRDIPLSKRTTIRSLANALGVSYSTLFRWLKFGKIRRHSNAIKPFLKEENKKSRLKFCLSMLDNSSIPHDPTFIGMYNIIHIDEKWFYMTKKNQNYYLLPEEEDPLRSCTSKNFIQKVMFLGVQGRPRFDTQGNVIFSGKIGIFPFVTKEPAKRNSINRVAGTMETKPITSVTRDVIRSWLIEKVLPAIKEKWPAEDSRNPIYIQQDNARTHIDPNDPQFRQVATQDGFDIRIICQPPNSPDLNVLDLGFFSAIQSLQYKETPKTVDDLVNVVEKAYEDFSVVKSNYIFLTLQSCMKAIMENKGSNDYKISHMKKKMLEKGGLLPTQLKCDPELVQEVRNYLAEFD